MNLVDRHLGLTILRHSAYALAGLLSVFAVVNLTEELRGAGSATWGVGRALGFVVLTLPSEAYTLLPASALLGTVLGLGRLVNDHEIVALEAAGISPWRVARAALGAALLLAIAGLVLGELVAAPLSQRAHTQRALALSGGRALSTASGMWLRDGSRFVNVGALRPDGSLDGVYLFDFGGGRELVRFTHARSAAPVDDAWQLNDLRESTFTDELSSDRVLATAPWITPLTPKRIEALWLEPRDLSLAELRRTIRALRAQRQNPLDHEVAFWRRVSAPVYMGVMVLLAVPMVMVGGRTVRIGERATLGALVGLGFQMSQEMFTNLGLVVGWPPIVIALVPALVALALVAVLFRRQRVQ
jgi:lipopolysaccharide export system permease protein